MGGFVLVPGACHGAWWYEHLVDRLTAAGRRSVAVTLLGLEPGGPDDVPQRPIALDDHVEQALEITQELAGDGDGRDVILVGHSYGGIVINGVADRMPERIRAMVYLDALVPDDGDSAWSLVAPELHEWYVGGARRTGLYLDPLPTFDRRARPHPLASLMQAAKLTGAWRKVPVKHYVEALNWPMPRTPLHPVVDKVTADPEFTVHRWEVGHNVLREGPDRVFDLVVDL